MSVTDAALAHVDLDRSRAEESAANVLLRKAQTIATLMSSGFGRAEAVEAVSSGDLSVLTRER